LADVSEVRNTSIIMQMMKAARTNETSVYFYETARRHIATAQCQGVTAYVNRSPRNKLKLKYPKAVIFTPLREPEISGRIIVSLEPG
jgi:hypothetical protein